MSTEGRRPGRPRSETAERAILDATLELLAEQGLEGVTMEAAAARAGVGKATIYRRWGSRIEMIGAAFASVDREVRIVEAGDVRGDLGLILAEFQRSTLRTLPPSAMSRMIALTLATPELRELFLEHVFQPRRAAVVAALERAQVRGEIRADIDPQLGFALIVGPLLMTGLLVSGEAVASPDLPLRLVDAVLAGLAPR